MTNILYMTTSQDGFVAGPHNETPWCDAEWEAFQEFVKSCDAILLGKRTYEIMLKANEFLDGPRYIDVSLDLEKTNSRELAPSVIQTHYRVRKDV